MLTTVMDPTGAVTYTVEDATVYLSAGWRKVDPPEPVTEPLDAGVSPVEVEPPRKRKAA